MTTFDNKVLTSQNPVWLKHNDYNVFGGPLKSYTKKQQQNQQNNSPNPSVSNTPPSNSDYSNSSSSSLKSFRKSIDLSKMSKKPKIINNPDEMDTSENSSDTTSKINQNFTLPAFNRILLRFFDINDHTKSILLPNIFISINGYPVEPERIDTPAMYPGEIDLTDFVYEFSQVTVKNNETSEINQNNNTTNPDKFKLEIFWTSSSTENSKKEVIEYGWCLFIAEKVAYDKLPNSYDEMTFDQDFYPERTRKILSMNKREKSRENSRSDSRNSNDGNRNYSKKMKYEDDYYRPKIRDDRVQDRPIIRDERRDSRDYRDNFRDNNSNFRDSESNYSANYMIEAISDPDLGRVEEERVKRFIENGNKQKIGEFIEGLISTGYALEHCVHYRKTYIIQKLFDCRNVDMKMKEKLAKHIINSQKDAVFYRK